MYDCPDERCAVAPASSSIPRYVASLQKTRPKKKKKKKKRQKKKKKKKKKVRRMMSDGINIKCSYVNGTKRVVMKEKQNQTTATSQRKSLSKPVVVQRYKKRKIIER